MRMKSSVPHRDCRIGGPGRTLRVVRAKLALVSCSAALALGCGTKSSVSLSAAVQNPALSIQTATLGASLSGAFELRLALGSNASESTTVSLEGFSLVRASDQSTLVSPLEAAPDTAFPLDVAVGSSKIVVFTLDDSKLLDPTDEDAICAEPVRIVGAVRDTLSGGDTTSLTSSDITVGGC